MVFVKKLKNYFGGQLYSSKISVPFSPDLLPGFTRTEVAKSLNSKIASAKPKIFTTAPSSPPLDFPQELENLPFLFLENVENLNLMHHARTHSNIQKLDC
jgi:hypothetical protein